MSERHWTSETETKSPIGEEERLKLVKWEQWVSAEWNCWDKKRYFRSSAQFVFRLYSWLWAFDNAFLYPETSFCIKKQKSSFVFESLRFPLSYSLVRIIMMHIRYNTAILNFKSKLEHKLSHNSRPAAQDRHLSLFHFTWCPMFLKDRLSHLECACHFNNELEHSQ